ncbi:MAG: hypothetical protein OEY39_05950 [Candidatus Bathyarchaeota archaeon]|nr:hypothetical protein [Candidatus Bathyarchaeota archaeon]MDH5419913.1 hypothetical protein [Candidatus Bathyarchaeota archaeon]MDH5623995.1 hypothetical protein [Candidatus Bathyarchaeota archaeon]MDH5635266.1 hypothetical protein [Candidatus Bathyarchaeota archaeon]MDH5701614.1 hypothetical protein [Candidatus Bathyarchaeota archaeon]
MSEEDKDSCACTQKLIDVLRAAKPKKGLLKKVTCAKCGKVFWTNMDGNLCFDCGEN